MATKLLRKIQKIFGSAAGPTELSQIGSYAASSPMFTNDPAIMQALSNFLTGWYGVAVGGNSPAIQDLNSLHFLVTRQLAYIFQSGIPEWESGTEYFIGSFVSDGLGGFYRSLADNNIGNALSDTTKWSKGGIKQQVFETDDSWVCPPGVTKIRALLTTTYAGKGTKDSGYTIGLTVDGDAYGFGSSLYGALGNNENATAYSSPILVLGGHKWLQLAGNMSTSFGINTNNDMYAWGDNSSGALGINVAPPGARSTPVLVVGGKKWAFISGSNASGVTHFGGITVDGDAYCWGANGNGEIGDNSIVPKSSPVLVLGGYKWKQLVCSAFSTFGITVDNDLYSWGDNTYGQLGINSIIPKSTPTLIGGGKKWKYISAGPYNTYAIDSNGDMYAWGSNTEGELGVGDINDRSTPTLVIGGRKWDLISKGLGQTYAIDTNRDLYSWGARAFGALGDGVISFSSFVSSPSIVLGGHKWLNVFGGDNGAVGITSNGDMYGWGNNEVGQLGSNAFETLQSTPVLVVGGKKWASSSSIILNEMVLDVVPGTTYDVKLLQSVLRIGIENLYSYNFTGSPQLVIEYPS